MLWSHLLLVLLFIFLTLFFFFFLKIFAKKSSKIFSFLQRWLKITMCQKKVFSLNICRNIFLISFVVVRIQTKYPITSLFLRVFLLLFMLSLYTIKLHYFFRAFAPTPLQSSLRSHIFNMLAAKLKRLTNLPYN